MLSIRQFRYGADNLAYVLHTDRHALAIDGGAVEEILSFLTSRGLSLRYVTNTHDHPDHTPGNGFLLKKTGAEYISPQTAASMENICLEEESIRVIPTPGHTEDSVVFHTNAMLITGDTLFNGTVGNCFTGDLAAFYASLTRLASLPPETRIYAGHDYVLSSMAFARSLEPGNPHIDAFLKHYGPGEVVSALKDELLANPYLRWNDPAMIRLLEAHSLPVMDAFTRFKSIMSLG